MAKTLRQAVRDLLKDAAKSPAAIKRILQPSTEGAGSRVYPPKSSRNDEKYGIRIDKGSAVGNRVEFNLQVNSNATKKSLKDLVRKNGSHAKYGSIQVDPKQDATKENLEKLADELCDSVNEKP